MTSLCRNTPELHLHISTVEMLNEKNPSHQHALCVYVVILLIVLPVCGCTNLCECNILASGHVSVLE